MNYNWRQLIIIRFEFILAIKHKNYWSGTLEGAEFADPSTNLITHDHETNIQAHCKGDMAQTVVDADMNVSRG